MLMSSFSIFSENCQRLTIDSIDFIEHLSVLVVDINLTEDIIYHLNQQLVQKYQIFKFLC